MQYINLRFVAVGGVGAIILITFPFSIMMTLKYKQIGTIFSPFEEKEGMPIQAIAANGIKGKIEINEDLEEALSDLIDFSHIFLIYSFHRSKGFELRTKPFLSEEPKGVFATRAPKRPNSIGISVVKIIGIHKNIIEIENVDVLNGTPLLDIKPYIPAFDNHRAERIGWLENKAIDLTQIRSDKRFD